MRPKEGRRMVTFENEDVLQTCLKFAGSRVSLSDFNDLPFAYTRGLVQKDLEGFNAKNVLAPLKRAALHLVCKNKGALQYDVDPDNLVSMMRDIHSAATPLVNKFQFFISLSNTAALKSDLSFFGDTQSEVFSSHAQLKSMSDRMHLSRHEIEQQQDLVNLFGFPRTARLHDEEGKLLNGKQKGYRSDMSKIWGKVLPNLLAHAYHMNSNTIQIQNTTWIHDPTTLAGVWLEVAQPYIDFLEKARKLPPLDDESIKTVQFPMGIMGYEQARRI
jgi:hypothetical protein